MKKIYEKIIITLICSIFCIAGLVPNNIVHAQTRSKKQVTISPENLKIGNEKAQEVLAFIKKVSPYLTKKNGKFSLTTHNEKTLGISKQEIQQFEQGLALANKVTVSTKKNVHNTNMNVVKPFVSANDNGSDLIITIPEWQVRTTLVVGAIAGLALGIYGLVSGDDEVLIIGEWLVYRDDFISIVGMVLTTTCTVVTDLWSGGDLTIDIPNEAFENIACDIEVWNDDGWWIFGI